MSFFSDSLIKKETFWFEQLPSACYQASGIVVNGRRIKSLVFTTDLAIIRNCDADAVFAVYPFTPQSAISHALINGSYIPIFCGCGGNTEESIQATIAAGANAITFIPPSTAELFKSMMAKYRES